MECIDDYFPCSKDDFGCENVKKWMGVYALNYNYVRDPMDLGRPPARDLERMAEEKRFHEIFRRCLT